MIHYLDQSITIINDRGKAWQGAAGPGMAGHGMAWQGKARFTNMEKIK